MNPCRKRVLPGHFLTLLLPSSLYQFSLLPVIQFSKCCFREFGTESTNNPLINTVIYSQHFSPWYCIYFVRRNSTWHPWELKGWWVLIKANIFTIFIAEFACKEYRWHNDPTVTRIFILKCHNFYHCFINLQSSWCLNIQSTNNYSIKQSVNLT